MNALNIYHQTAQLAQKLAKSQGYIFNYSSLHPGELEDRCKANPRIALFWRMACIAQEELHSLEMDDFLTEAISEI